MAFFKIEARDGSVSAIVRAPCKACARNRIIENSPASEVMLWRNPQLSKVSLVVDLPEGLDTTKRILQRIEK